MNKIIITGATSFLGVNLISELIKDNYVIAVVRVGSNKINKLPKSDNLKILELDIDKLPILAATEKNADCFVHLAWDSSLGRDCREQQQKNIEYSISALECASVLGCKTFVYTGSQAEYGKPDGLIYENLECSPISEYGKAKLEFGKLGFDFAKKNNMDFVHLRIFSVYGYGDRENTLVDYCIRSFLNGECASLGRCSHLWNYLYVKDFARIVSKIIDSKLPTGIYNVANNDTKYLKEFVVDIYEAAGKKGSYTLGGDIYNAEKSPSLNVDISKLSSCIGDFKFTDFTSGIKETISLYIK